jgi:hypothetical protein
MPKQEKSPFWQKLIDHIFNRWKEKKGFGYPFRGRDFKELKTATRVFPEWQLMALYDVFIENTGEWVVKSGYSVQAFISCLPWLVDDKYWKIRARSYEEKMVPALPAEILDLIQTIKK